MLFFSLSDDTHKDLELQIDNTLKPEKSGSDPIIIPIVLKMAEFDHKVFAPFSWHWSHTEILVFIVASWELKWEEKKLEMIWTYLKWSTDFKARRIEPIRLEALKGRWRSVKTLLKHNKKIMNITSDIA